MKQVDERAILLAILTVKVLTQICVKKESQRLKALLSNYIPDAKDKHEK